MVLQGDLNEVDKNFNRFVFRFQFDGLTKRLTQEIIFSLSKDLGFIGWSYES
ncbi:hypothetical protein LEP1GSC079_0350 [Leptospira interrogans str. FPW1039]|uniref:Uncharacterized protein n=1 Tax=Leptospira interrogans str. FPW1039 TaxID=1193040 RepID=A0A0F6IFY1_LEPIR|nr:hypothetical protein LEP1GSC079_0350 [Leptospira interrogans str. FPW1039]